MKFFVPNFRQIRYALATALFLFLAAVAFLAIPGEAVSDGVVESETLDKIVVGIVFALIGIAGAFCVLVLMPWGFTFSEENVRIYYLFFLKKEEGKWSEINRISLETDCYGKGFPRRYYSLYGLGGDDLFFMDGEIPKNIFTKYFITKYWDGTVSRPEKKKKKSLPPKPDPDEAVRAEREARKTVRDILAAREEDFKLCGLTPSADYCYDVGDDDDNSRPECDYIYRCDIILSTEYDENFGLSANLLTVKLKKTVYVPGPLSTAELTSLTAELDRILAGIRTMGLEEFTEAEYAD